MKHQKFIVFVVMLVISILLNSAGTEPRFVASRKSDVYHYLDCAYVKRIKDENKLYFLSRAEADSCGYHGCRLCKSYRDLYEWEKSK